MAKVIEFDLGKWVRDRAQRRADVALSSPGTLAQVAWVQALHPDLKAHLLKLWEQDEAADMTETLLVTLVEHLTYTEFLNDGK